jgi:endoglucanase
MYRQKITQRYKGFNLLGMFCSEASKYNNGSAPGYFPEEDFKMISDFGFNFVRLPLSYRVWSTAENPFEIDEEKIKPLDDAVEYGKKYGIHVCICLHRIPGYCVNDDEPIPEPFDLFEDEEAQKAACFQWRFIAERSKGIDNEHLSFNLFNEPKWSLAEYKVNNVYNRLIREIRSISPNSTIVIDGTHNGSQVPLGFMHFGKENCIYSCRGYQPGSLTHYPISWAIGNLKEPPKWPGALQISGGNAIVWNRAKIDEYFDLWAAVSNVYDRGVICGELGCYNKTPHETVLAWYEDLLASLKEHNIGFAVWNFRGAFGVMDSEREDVIYEDYNGHKLDRKLMDLLQKY